MKRILIVVALLLGVGIAGYQYTQYSSEKDVLNQLDSQIEATDAQIQQYTAMLSELPASQFSTNTDMLNAALNSKSVKLMQITAQVKDESGRYSNVATVNSVEETAFFTNTISRIVLDVSYKDVNKAYKYVSKLEVPYSAVNFDLKKKVISIYLVPVSIGDSDISSEFTTPVTDLQNTQSEDSQTTNKATSATESAGGAEDVIPSGVESTQMDIQYLGGDE